MNGIGFSFVLFCFILFYSFYFKLRFQFRKSKRCWPKLQIRNEDLKIDVENDLKKEKKTYMKLFEIIVITKKGTI